MEKQKQPLNFWEEFGSLVGFGIAALILWPWIEPLIQ